MSADVVRAVSGLTGRWVRELPAGNTVVSGLGLWPLLAILATAADEPGRSELAEAAGLADAGIDTGDAAGQAQRLVDLLDGSDDLHAALGVWLHERLKLAETFDSVVPAPVRGVLTGDAQRDKAMLDAWADEHTGGLIREMPLEADPSLVLVLASALALRTTWVTAFAEHPRAFYDGPWAGANATWLTRTDAELDAVRWYDDAGLTVATVRGAADVDVRLGLGTPDAGPAEVLPALLAADPDGGTGGAELLAGAQAGAEIAPGLSVATSTARRPDVQLSLPAFEVTAEHDLLGQAALFGLQAVSSRPLRESGHFSAISPEPLQVAQAKQAVLARFHATGFEAAAVTAVGMMRASAVISETTRLVVELDRPFGFGAVHRDSALPIVAGWLAHP